ncbi:MAG: hypothetical protein GEU88_19425 [Solirubrobacterales bacterium]|nr:hypothetical protein [Solirubrobacterales bacterium]
MHGWLWRQRSDLDQRRVADRLDHVPVAAAAGAVERRLEHRYRKYSEAEPLDRRSHSPPGDRPRDAADRLARTLAGGPELELDAWALGPAALELVLAEVAAGRERVVECGSGASTVLIARLLRERGRGFVRALEHDPAWAARTRRALAGEDLGAHAEVIEAPLRADPLAPPGTDAPCEQMFVSEPDGTRGCSRRPR